MDDIFERGLESEEPSSIIPRRGGRILFSRI
jgi:hypothetical protein